jgi:hypothetical protein
MKTLQWKIEKRKVKDLLPADYNPRKMTEEEEKDLKASIDEFGAVIPVVVNVGKRKNILVGGHQRSKLYAEKGIEEIDVMVPSRELTEEEEKKLNLRLNKNTGSWDFNKLATMDLTLLLEVGFGDDDLQVLFDDVEMIDDEFMSRSAGEVDVQTSKVKAGDIYQLGDHKLMCGDTDNTEHVHKLMDKEYADMVFIDPPKDKKNFTTKTSYALGNAVTVTKPNAHVFTWSDESQIGIVQTIYTQLKINTDRVCIWIKDQIQMTPKSAFNKIYEPCIYGTIGKPFLNPALKNVNEIINSDIAHGNQLQDEVLDYLTVWVAKNRKDDQYENRGKPVTLAEKPLKRCSSPGHIILNLFGDTGSVLIACEQIKRKARVMEADPVKCDIIIKRWEEFSNKKAKKI